MNEVISTKMNVYDDLSQSQNYPSSRKPNKLTICTTISFGLSALSASQYNVFFTHQHTDKKSSLLYPGISCLFPLTFNKLK